MTGLTVRDVTFTDTHFSVALIGGETFTRDLSRGRYSELARASAEERADWRLLDEGVKVSWPHLGRTGITIDANDLVWETLCDRALGEAKAKDWNLEEISLRSREIVALWRLEADVCNGGFMQFLCNWGIENCELALSALQAIGAIATRDIVARQLAIIERLRDHLELKSLDDLWTLLTPEELHEIGNKLDHEFWNVVEELPELGAKHYFK